MSGGGDRCPVSGSLDVVPSVLQTKCGTVRVTMHRVRVSLTAAANANKQNGQVRRAAEVIWRSTF